MTSNQRKYFGLTHQLGVDSFRIEELEEIIEKFPQPTQDEEENPTEYDDREDGYRELYLGSERR